MSDTVIDHDTLPEAEVGGLTQKSMMTIIIFLSVQAVIGIIAIEWAFAKNKRFQNVDETRDS